MKNYQATLVTPFAVLGIATDAGRLATIDFLAHDTPILLPQDTIASEICTQIERYLRDSHFRFDLPLAPTGTIFQQSIWQELLAIPSGSTISYSELAQRTGTGARAVANACGANPIPLVIPCHRVVAKHGLGGFMRGLEPESLSIKQWLLAHERS